MQTFLLAPGLSRILFSFRIVKFSFVAAETGMTAVENAAFASGVIAVLTVK